MIEEAIILTADKCEEMNFSPNRVGREIGAF